MRRLLSIAIALFLGCSGEAPRVASPPSAEGSPREESPRTTVGIADWVVDPAAARIHASALEAHVGGRFDESAAGFQEALNLSPYFTAVRFNLARAQARRGELDVAARLVRRVLEEDLPAFRARVREEPDLQGLGDRLDVDFEGLARAYRAAASSGTAVFTQQSKRMGDALHLRVRAGFYDHETRRFVPAADWFHHREPWEEYFPTFAGAVVVGDSSVLTLFVNSQPNHGIRKAWVEERELMTGARLARARVATGGYEQLFQVRLGWADGVPLLSAEDPEGMFGPAEIPRFRTPGDDVRLSGTVDPFGTTQGLTLSRSLESASQTARELPRGLERAWREVGEHSYRDEL
ncbi:MAG: tetratricopeptide repeat protein [Myxococcota bacterium]